MVNSDPDASWWSGAPAQTEPKRPSDPPGVTDQRSGPSARRPSWRAYGEVALATELCLLAAAPFVGLFPSGALAWRLLLAGLAGVVPGVLLRLRGRRPSPVSSFGVAVLVFLLVATVLCFRDVAVAGVVPTADVLSGIRDGIVDGPRQILTSAVPAPETGAMLLVPVAIAYWAVVVATELTWRTRSRLGVPVIVVVAFGVALSFEPTDTGGHLMTAAVIAGLSLLYLVARKPRSSTVSTEYEEGEVVASDRRRSAGTALFGTVVLVAVAMGLAVVAPVGADRRGLRDSIEPPVDPITVVNPLMLLNPVQRGDVVPTGVLDLSTPDGDMKVARLPIARLDSFECHSGFAPSTRAVASAGELPPLPSDPTMSIVTVNLTGAESRVLPAPGNVVQVTVRDGRPVYSDPTDRLIMVGATPIDGVEYRVLTAVTPDVGGDADFTVGRSTVDQAGLAKCEAASGADVSAALVAAGILTGSAQDRLQALARWCQGLRADPNLKEGDDLSLRRLIGSDPTSVLASGEGSAAQKVATCAYLGQRAGLPVQIAVGYVTSVADGRATAMTTDLSAWLEVSDTNGLMHPVPVLGKPDPSAGDPPESSATDKTGDDDVSPPPESTETNQPSVEEEGESDPPWVWVGAAAAAVLMSAAWRLSSRARRRRRRRRGSPEQRLAGAWMEAVDALGSVGVIADTFGPEDIARTADAFPAASEPLERLGAILATTFAPDPPTAAQADEAWRAVDQLRRGLRSRSHRPIPGPAAGSGSEPGSRTVETYR